MIDRCREIIAEDDARNAPDASVELVHGDVLDTEFENASMVVLNYTLQFLDLSARAALIQRIYDGLIDGGVLVLSEKVLDEDAHMEELLVDLHHEHKRRNDYSALEVARKRAALENVLVPETVSDHKARLREAGFSNSAVWLRYFNFRFDHRDPAMIDSDALTRGACRHWARRVAGRNLAARRTSFFTRRPWRLRALARRARSRRA